MAHAVSRSRENLARVTRSVTGRSIVDWIAECRMAEARRLLVESRASVEEVAWSVGYRDVSYFRRRFGEMHGCSPRDWRHMRQLGGHDRRRSRTHSTLEGALIDA